MKPSRFVRWNPDGRLARLCGRILETPGTHRPPHKPKSAALTIAGWRRAFIAVLWTHKTSASLVIGATGKDPGEALRLVPLQTKDSK